MDLLEPLRGPKIIHVKLLRREIHLRLKSDKVIIKKI